MVSAMSGEEIADTSLGMENRICPGCKLSAVNENGGLVVAFGQSFFHVDCFKCAKCGDQVTADTNLLLLSDGSPICANCSYSCNVCHLPILDEAIMTGDDSYHAHCFNCKVCKNRIDELVFAKTSQGIYCMNCHSERMIKIRRHAQKKADREKAAGSSSSRSREQEARNYHAEHGTHSSHAESGPSSLRGKPSSKPSSQDGHSSSRPGSTRGNEGVRSPSKSKSGPYVSDAFGSNGYASGSTTPAYSPHPMQSPQSALQSGKSSSHPIVVNVASPGSEHSPTVMTSPPSYQQSPVFSPPPIDKANSYPGPPEYGRTSSSDKRLPTPGIQSERSASPVQLRQSHEGGPLKVPPSHSRAESSSLSPARANSEGLNVPTSRRAKRRSINPGLVLSNFGTDKPLTNTPPTMSPSSMNFHGQTISYETSSTHGPDSSHIISPSRNNILDTSSFRSLHTTPVTSPVVSGVFYSASASPIPPEEDQADSSTGHLRSASTSTFHHQYAPDGVQPSSLSASATEHVPPNAQNNSSRREPIGNVRTLPLIPGPLSPPGPNDNTLRTQRSFDDRRSVHSGHRLSSSSNLHIGRSRSASTSRSPSPAHRADVPHSVESGTDTEAEGEGSRKSVENTAPALLPKGSAQNETGSDDPDNSVLSQVESAEGSDDMSDSSPVERVTHATFIAPALPPIRFSMSGPDFSDFLGSVGGNPSLKSLDHMARLTEENELDSDQAAAVMRMLGKQIPTPTSDITVYGNPSQIHPPDDDSTVVWKAGDTSLRPYGLSKSSSEDDHGNPDKSSSQVYLIDPHITLTEPGSSVSTSLKQETLELAMRRLQEALVDAKERGAQQLKLERRFVEVILAAMESRRTEYVELQTKCHGIQKSSKHYKDDLTVAQTDYDRELKARRDAEAEVTRLRVLLSGQAARLTALSGDTRRQEVREQLSKELSDNLSGLEHNLSKLRVERDMALAEVEELSASKSSSGNGHSEPPVTTLGRSLTMRLDSIKSEYQNELVPLKQTREMLTREIAELKSIRDAFLEETTALNARNEELAQLSAQYSRRMDSVEHKRDGPMSKRSFSSDKARPPQQPVVLSHSLSSSTNGSSAGSDETAVESKLGRVHKPDEYPTPSTKGKFKWPMSKTKESSSTVVSDANGKGKGYLEHTFQQLSILRFTRCDNCGDKMWGSQLRCSGCNISVHVRCVHHVHVSCTQTSSIQEMRGTPPPTSMFGRDLSEQVRIDSRGSQRQTPTIVEKCIDAVEALALDYEGIYRKSGGSGQSKTITHLFENGDYNAFDLRDSDRFNDICSVTSVLKSYFRSLPNPLLTYDLHENFMTAVEIKDLAIKNKILLELVNQLPDEYYYTLRMLMLHLYRVREHSEANLMTSRNLGVVFGPTLMRSRDPASEFSDMAGKALTVEWLVDNATSIFNQKQFLN